MPLALQIIDDVAKLNNTEYGNPVGLLDFLDRRALSFATLLAIQANGHAGELGASGFNHPHDFPDSRSGGDYVVDYQYSPLQRRAHQYATLTMALGLFAIIGEGNVQAVPVRKGHRSGGRQGNALVGRAQENIKFQPGINDAAALPGRLYPIRKEFESCLTPIPRTPIGS